MARRYVGPETKQRILACLKLNDGSVEDTRGFAISRLTNLMAGGYNRETVRAAVLAMESQQLVIRDTRGGVEKPNSPRGMTNVGARCYGVYLVNNDQDVEAWAIAELKEQIAARMIGKAKGTQHETKREQTKTKVAELSAVDVGNDPVAALAASLLQQVTAIIANPVKPAADPEKVKRLEDQNKQLQENVDRLQSIVEQTTAELESVKKQLSVAKSRRDPLTESVKNALSPAQWEQLMKQVPHESHD